MRQIALLIIGLYPQLIVGQYYYFNNAYFPPNYFETGMAGLTTNIVQIEDTTIVFGGLSESELSFNHFIKVDANGDVLNEFLEDLGESDDLIQYEESLSLMADGNHLLWGGSHAENGLRGQCVKFNSDLTREWTRVLDWSVSDSTFSDIQSAIELEDGNIVAAGEFNVDFGFEFNDDVSRLLICKYSPTGDSLWEKTIPLFENGMTGDKRYLRINQIFEQPNGDLLLTGALLFDWDQWFVRLTSEGEFISMFTMGGPLNDWLPWCAERVDGRILFGYNLCTEYLMGQSFYPKFNLRLGLFDPDIMDTLWTNTYNHTAYFQRIMDFEMTADGGGLILSQNGTAAQIPEQGIAGQGAYLLKCDSLGNEEWFRKVPPPIALNTDQNEAIKAYGIEITPEGDIVGVGNLNPEGANFGQYITWVWRTDCMGNTELPPIIFDPQMEPLGDNSFYCTSGSTSVYNVLWDFGEGTALYQDTLNYTFEELGEFEVHVTGQYCLLEFDTTIVIQSTDCMGNLATPALTIEASTTELTNSTFLFSATSDNLENFVWYFPDSEISGNNVEYTFADTGLFEIEVCGWYCDSIVCEVLEVQVDVGIHSHVYPSNLGIWIWPNPFSTSLAITLPVNAEVIVLLNAMGDEVYRQRATPEMTLDLSGCSPGIYLLEIMLDGITLAQKVAKE